VTTRRLALDSGWAVPLSGSDRAALLRVGGGEARERQTRVGPSFDTAEALFQIAIVLASIAILLKRRAFLYPSATIGVVALLFVLNGFLDVVPRLYDGPDKAPV
jgi:hypothetical protein